MRKLFFAHFVLSIGQGAPLTAMERIEEENSHSRASPFQAHKLQEGQQQKEKIKEPLSLPWSLIERRGEKLTRTWEASEENIQAYKNLAEKLCELGEQTKEQASKIMEVEGKTPGTMVWESSAGMIQGYASLAEKVCQLGKETEEQVTRIAKSVRNKGEKSGAIAWEASGENIQEYKKLAETLCELGGQAQEAIAKITGSIEKKGEKPKEPVWKASEEKIQKYKNVAEALRQLGKRTKTRVCSIEKMLAKPGIISWEPSEEKVQEYEKLAERPRQLGEEAKEKVAKIWKEATDSFHQLLLEEIKQLERVSLKEGPDSSEEINRSKNAHSKKGFDPFGVIDSDEVSALAACAWARMEGLEGKSAEIKNSLAKVLDIKEEASARELFSTLLFLTPRDVLESLGKAITRTMLLDYTSVDQHNTMGEGTELLLSKGRCGLLAPDPSTQDLPTAIKDATARKYKTLHQTEKSQKEGESLGNKIKSILEQIHELKDKHRQELQKSSNDQETERLNQAFRKARALKYYETMSCLEAPLRWRNVQRHLGNYADAKHRYAQRHLREESLGEMQTSAYILRNLSDKAVDLLCEDFPTLRELLLCLSRPSFRPLMQEESKKQAPPR